MSDRRDRPQGISPRTLVLAAVASAGATFVLARFGLTGTVIGAALSPILVALISEAVRRPAERVVARTAVAAPPRGRRPGRREGRGGPRREPERGRTVYGAERRRSFSLDRVPWRRVLLTGGAAFALVVAVVTVADFAFGTSVASDRGTTFFNRAPAPPADDERERDPATPPAPTEPAPTDPPLEEEETIPPPPSPAPEPTPTPPPPAPTPPAPEPPP